MSFFFGQLSREKIAFGSQLLEFFFIVEDTEKFFGDGLTGVHTKTIVRNLIIFFKKN